MLTEDNHVEERGGRERDNSGTLVELMVWLHARRGQLGIDVFPSQDIQVSATDRISADLCVTIGEPDGQVFTAPPFLCVEIHSIFEPMANQLRRIAAYLDFGVRHVWHIDPHKRRAMMYTATEAVWPEDGILRTENPDIALPLADLF
jgi:Uma2 family endonuclease